jgi:predicted RNA-binding protein with PUA domain
MMHATNRFLQCCKCIFDMNTHMLHALGFHVKKSKWRIQKLKPGKTCLKRKFQKSHNIGMAILEAWAGMLELP